MTTFSASQSSDLAAAREKRAVALTSLLIALLLAAVKLIMGLLSGSLGILADAVSSGLDIVTTMMTFLAVRVAHVPADERHTYGHGKAENLAVLIQTILLFGTCVWIGWQAIARLTGETPAGVRVTVWAVVVVILAIVVDFTRVRALRDAARRFHSPALEADAVHFSADMMESAVVLGGLILTRLGYPVADAVAALGVALLVLVASARLALQAGEVLMDTAPRGLAGALRLVVEEVAGVVACRRIRVRRAGPKTFVEMRLSVTSGLTLAEAHSIGQAAEQRMRALVPSADIVVQVVPGDEGSEAVVGGLQAIAGDLGVAIHQITAHRAEDGLSVTLHLEVEGSRPLEAVHALADRFEREARRRLPDLRQIVTHMEPAGSDGGGSGVDVANVSRVITDTIQERLGTQSYHALTIRTVRGRPWVALHCLFDGQLSLEEVHRRCDDLEHALRARLPDLVEVVVHAEPRTAARLRYAETMALHDGRIEEGRGGEEPWRPRE
ncbi:MAG: cation-efflux pump [Armatimonadetes bacterium]|nr:cation-efflux pump [Armatimonadota bacterium]